MIMQAYFCAPDGFDIQRFDELIAMMGDQGDRLIAHVIEDLGRVRAGLDTATPSHAQMRNSCHMLVALAGTLGAYRLQSSAQDLHSNAEAGADCDASETLRDLDGLLAYLAMRNISA